jgi:hypothetical protein
MSLMPPGQLVRGVLSPFERWAEVLFGLIMALTITGALSVAHATAEDSRALFFSALACNVAWGLVDGVMYVLNALFERGRRSLLARALRASADEAQVAEVLSDFLPRPFVGTLSPVELQGLRRKVLGHPELPERPRVHLVDLVGAAGVFLMVTVSTFPVALPFLLLPDPALAMRVSRALALLLLFLSGFAVGRFAGLSPVPVGLSMLGIGAVLVALVTALGG